MDRPTPEDELDPESYNLPDRRLRPRTASWPQPKELSFWAGAASEESLHL